MYGRGKEKQSHCELPKLYLWFVEETSKAVIETTFSLPCGADDGNPQSPTRR